jgi:outer membrane usher protein
MSAKQHIAIVLLSVPAMTQANLPPEGQTQAQPTAQYPLVINGGTSELSEQEEFIFDNSMFRGSNINQDVINRLSKKNTAEPGNYQVSIKVNNTSSGQDTVQVSLVNQKSEICISESLIKKAGFLPKYEKKLKDLLKEQNCVLLSEVVPEASVELDEDLSLNFTAPQIVLKNRSSDYVEISDLNAGEAVLFTNYTFNQYHNQQTGHNSGYSDYSYLNLNAGLNLGLWQFRQLSTYSYNNNKFGDQASHSSQWNNISSYVQRALPDVRSKLVIGQTNTTGRFLSGLSYSGIELSSDERMLPASQQGYAPIVAGIAKTNAVVEVRQNGLLIHQVMVPAGAFEIRDLNPTSYNGDLNVVIKEADGSSSSFDIPFASVPDSVRPGIFNYSIAGGKTRGLIENRHFVDGNIQFGINNSITLGGGVRVAKDYQAGVVSTVLTNRLGAFGLNATYSNANIGSDNQRHQGWMTSLTYSKSLQPTNTNISLAGYRYSTEGYREFSDFINEQYNARHSDGYQWSSSTYLQHYRLMMAVAQPLGDFGSLSLSASTQEYRDNRPRDVHYQASYSKMITQGISMSLNVSRQRTSRFDLSDEGRGYQSKYNTLTMLSFNIPLGSSRSTLSTSAMFDKENGNAYQASLGGNLGELDTPYSYGVNVNYDEKGSQTAYAANLNKQYSLASASVNASKGKEYWQAGAGLTGSLVLHRGGLTGGPYLGDTFAIIEAKGAEGAKVYNGQGAVINRFGYAVVPSLVPYRFNSVAITPDGIKNNNVDIESTEQQVAPYSGAAVKVKFSTNEGYPVLLRLTLKDGSSVIPMGAVVTDNKDRQLGLVGQNNQAYIRTPNIMDTLSVVWGNRPDQHCNFSYAIPATQRQESLIKLTALCDSPVENTWSQND